MTAHTPISIFGFTCLAFLMICVVIAVAAWFALKSGDQGRTKVGGVAGCLIAFALVCIAGLMGLGALAILFLAVRHEHARQGASSTYEFHLGEDEGEKGKNDLSSSGHDEKDEADSMDESSEESGSGMEAEHDGDEHASTDTVEVKLHFLLRGDGALSEVMTKLRTLTDGGMSNSVGTRTTSEGRFTELDVTLPIDRAKLDEFKKGLNEAWPDFKLPHGGTLELVEPRD